MGRTFDNNKDILKKLDDIAAAFNSDSSDASVDFEHTKNYDYGEDYVAALAKIEDAVKNSEKREVSELSDLSDVDIDNPTDGQIIRYDAETGKYVASNEVVGDSVSVTQEETEGVKIATITINGVSTDLFAPEGGGGNGGLVSDRVAVNLTTYTSENI